MPTVQMTMAWPCFCATSISCWAAAAAAGSVGAPGGVDMSVHCYNRRNWREKKRRKRPRGESEEIHKRGERQCGVLPFFLYGRLACATLSHVPPIRASYERVCISFDVPSIVFDYERSMRGRKVQSMEESRHQMLHCHLEGPNSHKIDTWAVAQMVLEG